MTGIVILVFTSDGTMVLVDVYLFKREHSNNLFYQDIIDILHSTIWDILINVFCCCFN